MLHKSFELLETKTDAEAGTFEATVAVFGNTDKGGDRIMPGAFDNTLAKWRESGDPIPIILSHSWNDPFHHIGIADPNDVMPTTKGLHVKGQLDITDNDVAKQVHRLMQRRSLKEFSFGYSVPKGGEKRAKDGANELLEIDLAEAGPTLKGMNPGTELHSVKSALEAETEHTAEALLEAVRTAVEAAKEQTEIFEKAELDLIREVQEMLGVKAEETDEGPEGAESVDPLLERSRRAVADIRLDGVPEHKSPQQEPEPPPGPPSEAELKEHYRAVTLQLLRGT